MKRITTDNVNEMGMVGLAHNCCYIGKDGAAIYRDFDIDIDARKLTIKLLEKYADIPNEFTCDEDFDDFMLYSLQHGTDDIRGLIAVFYRNLWAMAELRENLKRYEDLEEQGRLVVLPCKVDDDTESDLTKALRCVASQDPEGDCFMDHENMRRYETGEQIIECCSNPVEGERCPFHQSTYGVCFEDGDCMEWLGKAADEIVMLQAALEKMGGGEG